MKNPTITNLEKQIAAKKEELKKLTDCKNYIWNNFQATRKECDTVLDIIAQVIDRKETEIHELKEKIIDAL